MRTDEPARSDPGDRLSALRTAIEAGCDAEGVAAPSFSPDGGASVSDPWGRVARVQPLGQRTRISLTAENGLEAEAEVDTDSLVAEIAAHRSVYGAIGAALDRENRPG
ncbi:hypothetical protein [Actinomycetospora sp.]|uniref:hypothetical protein n=1 Tax=Actinomycetospora sp. TaxID=1872135 RepID=UPI002F3ED50D